LLLLVLLGTPLVLVAQDEDTKFPLDHFYVKRQKNARGLFKHFRFGLSVGYGTNYFSHQLKDSLGIYQPSGKPPDIFHQNNLGIRYRNWINNSVIDTAKTETGAFLVRSDTAKIGFKGTSFNIPIKATIHYEFLERYRIGAGYSYEYMSMGTFSPISYRDKIHTMKPTSPSGYMSKYFGSIGAAFARWQDYLFIADLNIGGFKPGNNFSSNIQKGAYVNLGLSAERELSEYLRLFIRPSFEFKSYSLLLPEVNKSIHQNMNAFYVNVGITYAIPELPKCYVKTCRIQMNHAHGNKEYRSRVHPIYKKQNPGYGENNPLIKDSRKNRKKINPY
jgi:hypothetical protein